MSEPARRPLRRDAAENAERVRAAAVRAGLNRGSQVPMAEIAAEAGVGVGTLYRRYRNRDDLMLALQLRAFRMLVDVAEQAQADAPTGREAVEGFLRGSFAIRDQLVLPMHGAPWRGDEASVTLRRRVRDRLTAIVERGHADGTVREEVTAWTVVQFGAMLAQPLPGSTATDENAATQREIFLRGIRPD